MLESADMTKKIIYSFKNKLKTREEKSKSRGNFIKKNMHHSISPKEKKNYQDILRKNAELLKQTRLKRLKNMSKW